MGRVDALDDFKRSKRNCKEFSNELEDFKRHMNDKDGIDSSYLKFLHYVLDNAELSIDDKRTREDIIYNDEEDESDEESDEEDEFNEAEKSEEESNPEYENQPVKVNKILRIQVKVEGQKACTSNPISEQLCNPAQRGMKTKIQTKRKLPEVIPIDDDDEDTYSQSGPCHNQADLPRPKEPSKVSHRSKAGTSNSVFEKLYEKVKGHEEQKFMGVKVDQPAKKKVGKYLSENAGASNSLPEKPCVLSHPAQQGPKAKSQKAGQLKEVNKDHPVKKNKILQIQVKVEEKTDMGNSLPEKPCELSHPAQQGPKAKRQRAVEFNEVNKDHPVKNNHPSKKAGTSNSAFEKLYEKVKGHEEPKFKGVKVDQPVKEKVEKHFEKAGASNSLPEKPCELSHRAQQGLKAKSQKASESKEVNKDHPVKKNKILQIQVKVEEKTDMGNSVSEKMSGQAPPSQPGLRVNSQKQMRSPKVIVVDDDDEDLHISSGQKDKGKSVVSDIPGVEILDNAALSMQGNPFVPSKNYHESVSDENDETLAFRNDVLKVLREPFNPTEYDRLYKDFVGGSYHVHYKDVKMKLHKVRREKRWIILRGFFFWLQNLPRPGAFEPWTDRVCLEVERRHVGEGDNVRARPPVNQVYRRRLKKIT